MKQNILIVSIILFSLLGWAIGAFWVLSLSWNQTSLQLSPPRGESKLQDISPLLVGEGQGEVSSGEKTIHPLKNLQSEITSTVENIAPSIVSIVVNKDLVIFRNDPWGFFREPSWVVNRKIWGGSWFFIKKDGTILTNKHVVSDRDAKYTVILSDGTEYDAQVLALDPVNDLAVIKISDEKKEFSPLKVHASTQNIQIGQFAIAVWNALAEFQNSVSLGIVSGIDRSIKAEGTRLTGLIQTDTAINPGNSWGPLLDLGGKVLGINTAIASWSNGIGFAFALEQERIDYILKSIQEHGHIKRPFIGINFIPNSTSIAGKLGLSIDHGVYVAEVINWSSAEKIGLRQGDIITKINGEKAYHELLGKTIQNSLPGDTLELEVLKQTGRTKRLDLVLWEY